MTEPNQTSRTAGVMPWRPSQWGIIVAVLALAFSLGWWTRAPEVSTGGDEATYIILSQSLEHGRYQSEFLLGAPPHRKYPPGNPLWIGFLRMVAGPDLEVVRAANVLLLLITGLLVGDAVRRLCSGWAGIAGLGLTIFSPALLAWSGTALSELPFTVLATLSAWAALRADEDRSPAWTGVSSAASIASFLTRTVGVAAMAGVGLWLLLRRRWRDAVVHGVASAVSFAAWFAWTAFPGPGPSGQSYAEDFARIGSRVQEGSGGIVGLVTANATEYLVRTLPSALSLPTVPGTPLDNIAWMAILAVSMTAGFLVLLRRWPALDIYVLLSAGVLLVWAYPIERLFAPLVPAVVALLLVGVHTVSRYGRAWTQVAAPLVLAGLLVPSQINAHLAQDLFRRCDRADPYTDAACASAAARDLVAGARFIRDSLDAAAVVATYKSATVYYFSGHTTVPLGGPIRQARTTDTLDLASLGVGYVLLGNTHDFERKVGAQVLGRQCEALTVRARLSRTTLLLAPRDASSFSEDACAALRDYRDAIASNTDTPASPRRAP